MKSERVKLADSSMVPPAVFVISPKAVATRSRALMIATAATAAPRLRGFHVSVRLILLLGVWVRVSPLAPDFPFPLVEAVLGCWGRGLRPWLRVRRFGL
jgi:hypothetical protein